MVGGLDEWLLNIASVGMKNMGIITQRVLSPLF